MTYKERYAPAIPFIPYLKHPLGDAKFTINEGFIYSKEEHSVHGYYVHGGIDFDCEFGTPVYAPADGLAVATYHRFVIRNKEGKIRLYQGKPLGGGMGYMIQLYHFADITKGAGNRITQFGHLSHIVPEIKLQLLPPKVKKLSVEEEKLAEKYPWIKYHYGLTVTDEDKEIYLNNHHETQQLLEQKSLYVTEVKQGQFIGRVGNSGIIWGELNYAEATNDISGLDGVPKLDTWDAPHLHFEEATRNEAGAKVLRRDPYNLYLSRKWYQKTITQSLFI